MNWLKRKYRTWQELRAYVKYWREMWDDYDPYN